MAIYVNTFFEERLQQLLGLAGRIEAAFASAGLEYRVVGGLAVYDASTAPGGEVGCDQIKTLLRERLALLPPFRWRLAEVPFGLDYPYWVDDPEFDLDFHVREIALAKPGDDRQLAEQVSRIMSRPLDRARPLWELYVIDGLQSGRTAVLSKIHHAVIDGMSGAEIMGLLLDLSPDGRQLPPTGDGQAAGQEPGQLEMLGRGVAGVTRYPVRLLRSLPRAIPNVDETPFGVLPGAGTIGGVTRTILRRSQRPPRPFPVITWGMRARAGMRKTTGNHRWRHMPSATASWSCACSNDSAGFPVRI